MCVHSKERRKKRRCFRTSTARQFRSRAEEGAHTHASGCTSQQRRTFTLSARIRIQFRLGPPTNQTECSHFSLFPASGKGCPQKLIFFAHERERTHAHTHASLCPAQCAKLTRRQQNECFVLFSCCCCLLLLLLPCAAPGNGSDGPRCASPAGTYRSCQLGVFSAAGSNLDGVCGNDC